MNTVQKNAILSVVTLVLATAALVVSQQDSGADVPWLPIAGVVTASVILGLMLWRRPPGKPAPQPPKRNRRK
jgi:hypothetical protein